MERMHMLHEATYYTVQNVVLSHCCHTQVESLLSWMPDVYAVSRFDIKSVL
jgi:hypothetical protein